MAEDIIATIPVQSFSGWVHEHFWRYDDGTYSRCDNDGNHEDCDEDDIPNHSEQQALWREYAAYVVETGTDPLAEYLVKKEYVRKEAWEFKFAPGLGGAALLEVRHGKHRYTRPHLHTMPQHVKDYLNLRHSGRLSYLNDFTTWEEFVARVPDVKKDVWWKHTFHREVPRTWKAYQRDLLRAARRAMKGGY